jgi:hypothetical protein
MVVRTVLHQTSRREFMTEICERCVVACPEHKASHYLATFVADHRVGDGTVRFELRRPIIKFTDRRQVTERPLVATLSLQSMSDLDPTYCGTWMPKGDGPSPEFAGTLAVEKCRRDDCFRLILRGHYEPVSPIGVRSDAKVGSRTARVSARDVLRAIVRYVTDAYAHDEAALAGHRRYVRP